MIGLSDDRMIGCLIDPLCNPPSLREGARGRVYNVGLLSEIVHPLPNLPPEGEGISSRKMDGDSR
jgi:hypothetical protein